MRTLTRLTLPRPRPRSVRRIVAGRAIAKPPRRRRPATLTAAIGADPYLTGSVPGGPAGAARDASAWLASDLVRLDTEGAAPAPGGWLASGLDVDPLATGEPIANN